MCAINPKRQRHFTLSVYTAADMIDSEWEMLITAKLFDMELRLNSDMRLRWHIQDRSVDEPTSL